MTSRFNHSKGRVLVELVLVMTILLFFGTYTFMVVVAGQQTSRGLIQQQEGQTELRTAYAYVNTRLRQHDEENMVSVQPHPHLGTNALVLGEEYYGTYLETWVYHSEGYLREALLTPDGILDDDMSFPVARLTDFKISGDDQGQVVTIEFFQDLGGETLHQRTWHRLRTNQEDQ